MLPHVLIRELSRTVLAEKTGPNTRRLSTAVPLAVQADALSYHHVPANSAPQRPSSLTPATGMVSVSL